MSKSKCIALFIAILVAIYNFRSSPFSLRESIEIIYEKDLLIPIIELFIIGFGFALFSFLVLLPPILEYFYKRCSWFKDFIDYSVKDNDKDEH